MLMIQMTGVSGAGKSSIASSTQENLIELAYKLQLPDVDDCRKTFCGDFGNYITDRLENT